MTDIIHSVFTQVAWDNVAAVEAPTVVNGAGVLLDLNTPTTHVANIAKFVVNAQNDITLRATIAYVLAIASDNPEDAPTEDLSEDVLVSAASWIGANVIRREFHQIMHNLSVTLVFRASDTIAHGDFADAVHGHDDYYLGQADRVWGVLARTPGALERITTFRQEAAKAIIANANHRELEENHNWYTTNQNVEGTSTCRLLACGGSGIDRFRVFMGIYGHDMWHYMDNISLRKVAHMLSGGVCERVDAPVEGVNENPVAYHNADGDTDLNIYGDYVRDSSDIPYRPNGPVILENFRIGDTTHARIPIDHVIDIGQAAKDRFPGNMVGIAGLITGVQVIVSMISSVSSVVVIEQAEALISNYATLRTMITSSTMDRTGLLALKEALQNAVAFAYGYSQDTPELREQANQYASLTSLARRSGDQVSRGSVFARRIRELATDPNAVESAIGSAFASMADVFTAIGQIENLDIANAEFRPTGPVNVQIYRNADQLANEVQRRNLAARLANPDQVEM